jgi:hypothetical protein
LGAGSGGLSTWPFATSNECLFLDGSESVYWALTSLLLSDVDDDETPRSSESECLACVGCNACSGLTVDVLLELMLPLLSFLTWLSLELPECLVSDPILANSLLGVITVVVVVV